MPGQLAAKLLELGATSHWPLGEAAGDAIDVIAGDDGAVTIGAGTRNAAPLNDQGDGSIDCDGVDTHIVVTATANVSNTFDGGGFIFFMFNVNSDGGGSSARVWGKGSDLFLMSDEAGGNVRIRLRLVWTTNAADFQTAVDIPITTTVIGVWVYDADAAGNLPTLFIHDGTSQTTRTEGSGLTRVGAANSGTRSSNAGSDLFIADSPTASRSIDGRVDEFAQGSGVTLNEAQATELIDLALQEIAAAEGGALLAGSQQTQVVRVARIVAT